MSIPTRNHPAEKAGVWLPKDGTTWEEQRNYVESDKGELETILPLSITQSHIDRGGYLRDDCALSIAFTEALGYDVILVGEMLYPIGKLKVEPKYVDEAINACKVWRRNYTIYNELYEWWKQDFEHKKYGFSLYTSAEPVKPITIDLDRANAFGVWFMNIV